MGFYSQDASMPLHGPDFFRDAPATVLLHFQVWSPQTQWSALVPGDATYSTLHHVLHALAAPQGRGIPVLRQPQGIARSVQLVSPASDKNLVTVLVDTGTAIDCVDVPRKGAGQALQAVLQSLYPQSTFRLEVLPTQVLRHGDVIQAHRDERRVFEVGAFLVPEVKHSERWLVGATEILITSVDLGVVRVRVPTRHTPDSLMDALQQCFGHQRCHGAYLHRLSIQQRSLDIYCLSRGNQDTLTAVLSDVDEASGLILLTTIDGPRDEPLSVDSLRWAPESLGDFWQDVLTRDVVWLRTVKNRFAPAGPLRTLVFLGLDYCRAARFGWSPSATARMGLYDLRMPGNLHWEVPVVGSITRQVAAQTLPSHWPLQATPLYSDAIPVRSQPTRCVAAPGHFPAGAMYRLDCPRR